MEQVQGGWEGGGVMSEKRCLVSSLDYLSGVSRISARGVLKVRPHTKSGGGGGGRAGASGPIYEKWGGGGGGGHSASGPIPLSTQKISTCTYLR